MELIKKKTIEEVKPLKQKEKETTTVDTKPAEQVLRERNLSKPANPSNIRTSNSTRTPALTMSMKSTIKISPEKEKENEKLKKKQELLDAKKTVEESLAELERHAGEKSKDKKEKKSVRKAKLDEFDHVREKLKKDLEQVEKSIAELDKEDKK